MSMAKQIILIKKWLCDRKYIKTSSNLASCDASNKNEIGNTNSKSSEFFFDNDMINQAVIDKVMDKNLCKKHQESEESKSREVCYSSEDFSPLLRKIYRKNMNRIKIAQLNINFIRNKLDLFVPAVVRSVNILSITETKIETSFPEGQFEIDGFTTPYRVDKD